VSGRTSGTARASGLSQEELARRAGLTASEVELIEGGATVPTLRLLRALAQGLDAKLDLSIEDDETHVSFIASAA
jgi:transcriptional regulator with XRE-family HTH domain